MPVDLDDSQLKYLSGMSPKPLNSDLTKVALGPADAALAQPFEAVGSHGKKNVLVSKHPSASEGSSSIANPQAQSSPQLEGPYLLADDETDLARGEDPNLDHIAEETCESVDSRDSAMKSHFNEGAAPN